MIMNSPLELWKLLQGEARTESEKLEALAAMADAPGEDFQPKMRLPKTNKVPAFKLGDGGVGAQITGFDYGIAAPMPEQASMPAELSIGQLLVGEK